MQLNLFTNITCAHCGTNPGYKPMNPTLWNGFFDRDTLQHVCWKCYPVHYARKQKQFTSGGMTYSEMPVLATQPMTVFVTKKRKS